MERVKKQFKVVHLSLWVIFCLLVGLQLSAQGHPNWLWLTVAFLITCLYVFYSHFYFLTRYGGKRKGSGYFLRLAIILFTGPIPLLLVYFQKLDTIDALLEMYRVNLVVTVPVFLFLSWLARVTENLVLNTIRKQELEKVAVEAELFYLKAQINPHFLFNTLNNIYTLVYKQAPTAPEAVLRLSSLMRYMIYESNAHTVPLSREMKYLEDYIALQQLRYKNDGVINVEITGDANQCFIAPLLFIDFLENAYKHSPARLEPGDIRVKVALTENTLVFVCENKSRVKHTNALNEPGGIGLPNIIKRLALLYPEKHSLEINNTGEKFTVTLTIRDLHLQAYESKANVLYN